MAISLKGNDESTYSNDVAISGDLSAAGGMFSGTLLVGADSLSVTSTAILQGNSGDANGPAILRLGTKEAAPSDTNASIGGVYFTAANQITAAAVEAHPTGGTWTPGSSHPTKLVFRTTENGASTPSERMWIDGGGSVKVGGTIASPNITLNANGRIDATNNNPDYAIVAKNNGGSSTTVYAENMSTGGYVWAGNNGSSNTSRITTSGTIEAVNTTISPISSERRLKENIVAVDANKAWDTVKDTPYYSYNFIGSAEASYGPMADEVPAEMVINTDRSDEEGVIRTYDNGMLQARLYVALQTALTRIEALEAEVQALKGGN